MALNNEFIRFYYDRYMDKKKNGRPKKLKYGDEGYKPYEFEVEKNRLPGRPVGAYNKKKPIAVVNAIEVSPELSFGIFLKRARLRRGLSAKRVADKFGWKTPQYVYNLEKERSTLPEKYIRKFASLYKINASKLKDIVLSYLHRKLDESYNPTLATQGGWRKKETGPKRTFFERRRAKDGQVNSNGRTPPRQREDK